MLVLVLTALYLFLSHTGIARCTSEEDVYEGYTIPKGTIVMPNIWFVVSVSAILNRPYSNLAQGDRIREAWAIRPARLRPRTLPREDRRSTHRPNDVLGLWLCASVSVRVVLRASSSSSY